MFVSGIRLHPLDVPASALTPSTSGEWGITQAGSTAAGNLALI